jgi:microcystin-dependent protein
MAAPFVGEIRAFAFEFAPSGWAKCDGQLIPMAQNMALFAVIGTTFGSSGNQFRLPDLRGRAALQPGAGPGLTARALGETGGAATVTLEAAQMPAHTHEVRARGDAGGAATPQGNVFGAAQARALSAGYSGAAPSVAMSPAAVESTGEGQAHNNMPPYLPLNYCIALDGEFPS